jgi:hypothetical protein
MTVAQIQSDDSNHVASSSGGTMLPLQVSVSPPGDGLHLKQTAAVAAAMPDSPGGASACCGRLGGIPRSY